MDQLLDELSNWWRQLNNCPTCQSIWISTAIVSALAILVTPYLVLAFPAIWLIIQHQLDQTPQPSAESAQRVYERYRKQ